jgi:Pectate lyase superfamily protein
MSIKALPTTGDTNWGTSLNNYLTQLTDNANGGGINTFTAFSQRPTNLTADDKGKTYLYTQTGNLHQWDGTTWKVLNESVINVKDYGAVGDGVADDYQAIQNLLDSTPSGSPLYNGNQYFISIYFPKGRYATSKQLLLKNRAAVQLFGDGKWVSVITGLYPFNTSLGKSIFKIQGGDSHSITKLQFNGKELGASGLEIHTDFNTDIIDCAAFSHHQNGGTDPLGGIHITQGKHIRIKDCNLHNGLGYGILFMNKQGGDSVLDDLVIDSCHFDEQPCGIYFASFCTGPVLIKNCMFSSMGNIGNGEKYYGYCIASDVIIWDLTISNCNFKNADIGIRFVTRDEMRNLQIKDNTFINMSKFSICQTGGTVWKSGTISGNTFILGKLATTISNQAIPAINTQPENSTYSCAVYMMASWIPALNITNNIFQDEDNLARYQVVIQPNDIKNDPNTSIINNNIFLGNQALGIYFGSNRILGKSPNPNT